MNERFIPIQTILKGYWDLEESSGNRVDVHTLVGPFTPVNTPINTTGKVGNAVVIDRTNARCLAQTSNSYTNMQDQSFEWLLWVYLNSLPAGAHILSKIQSTGNNGHTLALNPVNDQYRFQIALSSIVYTVNSITYGAAQTSVWTFISMRYDAVGDQMYLSVNLGTEDTAVMSGGPGNNTDDFSLGSFRNLSSFSDCYIDEVALFVGGFLTAGERAVFYNSGAGRNYASLYRPLRGRSIV